MALETGTYISDLTETNPVSTDGLAQADDHLRLIKSTLKATFANVTGAVTASHEELNILDGATVTTEELNTLDGYTGTVDDLNYAKDLRAAGVTVSELDVLDGITASTAELNKLDGFTGTAADLNYAKDLRATGVTATEFDKLDGFTGTATDLNYAKDLRSTGVTSTEFDYLDGVTSNIQTQLNAKAASARTISAGGGLTGGGNLTANRTISHANTSSQGNVNNSGNTFIQDISVDTYGHITSIGSGSVSVGNGTLTVQGTGALGGSGTFTANQSSNKTISITHDDTSSQSSVNNSGNTVIQDVLLDGYGHVTTLRSKTIDTMTNSEAISAQKSSNAYVVGHYMLLVALGGSSGAFNGTLGGGNLAAASCAGNAYRQSSSVIYSMSGSWRRMGYQEHDGTLSAQPGDSRTTLWIRYA